jgi:CheY-like chemotaxis protein
LVCSQDELEPDLSGTLLWRRDIERHFARRLEEARMLALAARPSVVLVDRDLPQSAVLIAQLRQDPATRGLSIAVLSRGDFDPGEVELLEAGANAILRLPPGPDWDARLLSLLQVPVRREIRIPVQFAVEAAAGGPAVPALALNISAHGMLMESHARLTVGDELQMCFELPEPVAVVTGRARVVRQAAATQHGVAFLSLDGDGRARVESFVDGAKAAG